MSDRLVLRFVSRCQSVDQFARVFCANAQADRLAVPLAMESPPVGTRLRASVALANKVAVVEGDAEIVEITAGTVLLRFHALDPRSRGFLAHLVAHRALDPAPVPRHLVPMGAAIVGGATGADPALGTCIIESVGTGPVPQLVDSSATTRTMAAPPVHRSTPTIDPARVAAMAAARSKGRETPTVTGIPTATLGGPPPPRPPAPSAPASGGVVAAVEDDSRTMPMPALARRAAPPAASIDDHATDIVAALPDARGDESDPAIDPPAPGQARAPSYPPQALPVASVVVAPHAMGAPPVVMNAPPVAMNAPPHAMGAPPVAPGGHYPPAPAPYPALALAAPQPMANYPAPVPAPSAPPRPVNSVEVSPELMAAPMPAAVLSPANVGSAVAGPASAAAWPMPTPPPGWTATPPQGPPAGGGYPTAQLPALNYDGSVRGALGRRDRRRPVEMEGDSDMTEIVTVPRPIARRRWPVIVASSVVVVVIVIVAIIAATSGGAPAPAAPRPAPSPTPNLTPTPSPAPPAPAPAPAPPAPTAIAPNGEPSAAPAPAPTGAPPPPPAPAEPTAAPPAGAPAPVGTCTFTFESSPSGAQVTVDGAALGTTPFTADRPCAPLVASFKRDRFRVERAAVTPKGGAQTVRVTLDRQTFKVKVTSRPAGATITIGSRTAGKTPTTVTVPGWENVTITATRSGFAPMSQKVYANRNGLAFDLKLRRK